MKLRSNKEVGKTDSESYEIENSHMNSITKCKKLDDKKDTDHETSNLEGDYANVLLLLLLYVLQGIPLGLAGSIPMILQNKNVSYKQQAMFSFVYWPFSLKLLWAPIVDAAFFRQFGRRKTWLVPVQYLIGIFMLMLSHVSICCLIWRNFHKI